jgi:RNA polymerase sigma-70 factor (ECF subfamily)
MTSNDFKIEVLPLKQKLYRFAHRLVKNSQEAEDVVQEVFIRLWMRREQLTEYRSIEAFAMTVTRNLSLDKLKRAGANTVELTDRDIVFIENTPHHELEINDAYNRIKRLIDRLPDQQRMIIHLRDVEGYPYEEIAEITGLTENNVRVNISRARKWIREIMIKKDSYEITGN